MTGCTVLQKTLEVSVGQATLTPSVQSAADSVYPSDAQSGEAVQFNAAIAEVEKKVPKTPLKINADFLFIAFLLFCA